LAQIKKAEILSLRCSSCKLFLCLWISNSLGFLF